MTPVSREHQFKETFRQEANEHLNNIEYTLLDLEQTPDDPDCVNRLFRAIHTIKGSGAMFGFEDIAALAHHAETLLDEVREGLTPITGELVDLMFLVKDQIKAMLDAEETGYQTDREVCDKIVAKLNCLLPDQKRQPVAPVSEPGATGSENNKEKTSVYRIRFRPNPLIMTTGMDPKRLLDELRELGECNIIANSEAVPPLETLTPDNIFFSWDIFLTADVDADTIREVFIFVEDGSDIAIQRLDDETRQADAARPRLGEILVGRGDVAPENVDGVIQKQKRIGEMLVESGDATTADIDSALLEQQIIKKRRSENDGDTVRISSEKLDKLINLVGEIVVTQSHLNILAAENEDAVFDAPIKQMERLTGDLREFALDMRMLPVGTLFDRFRRLVRDLSCLLGKEVELDVKGGQTELDKTILERLHDPLVHLIRNSIDHGLESPEEREKAGKPRKGVIRLTASHKGARVSITAADDGTGINTAFVQAQALKIGFISSEDALSETEIHELIFKPGFSTAREITDVSGRGVGLDVVKQTIHALGGTIGIESVKDRGTAFHLSLPLTLAIIEGLHVKADGRDFVIPVSQVETCSELKGVSLAASETRQMIRLKGEMMPFIRLRTFFRMQGAPGPVEHVAAVQTGQHRIAVVVDEVLGNIQTVIKPLDPLYRLAEGVSGATVMGNGAIALIIDLPELIRCVKTEKTKSSGKRVPTTG